MSPKLESKKFNGWETLVNKELGYAPYFSSLLQYRIKRQLACNVIVTGEPRIGKSYMATDIARIYEGLTKTGHDRFKVGQIAYFFTGFMQLTMKLSIGRSIVFDEPSYAMGKRDWYKDVNKALVLTIESKGFKVHPLFIPIMNKALLDKTIRSYLIQFQVVMFDRGTAVVYRIEPSQYEDKVYRHFLCRLKYGLFDNDLCPLSTCLGCHKLEDQTESCLIFRAQYERQKAAIQDERYEQAIEEGIKKETEVLTDDQIETRLYSVRNRIINDAGKIDVTLLRIVAKEELKLKLGHNRAYTFKKRLEYHHPEEF